MLALTSGFGPRPCMSRWLAAFLPFLIVCPRLASTELEPIQPGPFPVATTNLEVTPYDSKVMFDCLNGKASSGVTKYLTAFQDGIVNVKR